MRRLTMAVICCTTLALPACSATPTASRNGPTVNPTGEPTAASASAAAGATAGQVIAAFQAAGLPVPDQRDNSRNCDDLGCVQLITTEAISVYQWPDSAGAKRQADVLGDDGYRVGGIVLSYAAARTPEENRRAYERAAEAAVGGAAG
jgi:hypothetical protein